MTQWDAFINFFTYLGISIPILVLGVVVFAVTTPYPEFQMLKEASQMDDASKVAAGKAAAYDLSGKILGLTIVLASAILSAQNIVDFIIWGVIGVVFQVLVFYLFHLITPFSVIKEIPKGNVSIAIFSSRISLISSLILAASIYY
ncbi:DUF350 domain-containing protein [Thermoactinomyces sp. DSM 45892]|uniref:DUF350 domain-containing protein n=1 Tax=Thermoactinomyces sp. DSM 45892 TaxID=1882753 RepID=UPI000897B239|nr:DUF350 domain-containing protein [Thermoactinomyces sp. DSM 45892]SDZ20566.1 putative membrane protein [Thermoactinomyces sp. DSM 45892]